MTPHIIQSQLSGNIPMEEDQQGSEFGFNGTDPIEPYPLDKINVGPGSFSSRLNARRIPLFQYLFMLEPNKKNKKYGWGEIF